MESLLKLLSPYELRARTLPGMLMLSPIAAVLVSVIPLLQSWQGLGGIALAWVIVSYPVGQWMRDIAQPRQAALFQSWGGPPTTQVMRWSDSTIEPEEKVFARNSVLELRVFEWLDADAEARNPAQADAHLGVLVGAILSNARRNPDLHERMDRASAHFGFQRNCWYSRKDGSLIAVLGAVVCGFLITVQSPESSAVLLLFSEGFCISILLFWIFGVSPIRLRRSADAFAIEVFRHIPILVESRQAATR